MNAVSMQIWALHHTRWLVVSILLLILSSIYGYMYKVNTLWVLMLPRFSVTPTNQAICSYLQGFSLCSYLDCL